MVFSVQDCFRDLFVEGGLGVQEVWGRSEVGREVELIFMWAQNTEAFYPLSYIYFFLG